MNAKLKKNTVTGTTFANEKSTSELLKPFLNEKGVLVKRDFYRLLKKKGIYLTDQRIQKLRTEFAATKHKAYVDADELESVFYDKPAIIENLLMNDLVIPDFESFADKIKDIFEEVAKNDAGKVADYIPQLGRVNPDYFGVSICTVDGQRLDLGNTDVAYSVQSTSKPVTYSLALEELGVDKVHEHVGREPSGRGFNELTLNQDGLPHNPMINAGAIMCASMIRHDLGVSDRFDYVLQQWERLCGGKKPGFNNSIYLSEKGTADRNHALAYFMREKQAFPEWADLLESLDFYFQCCSIEIDCGMHSSIAATLANAGICPTTGDKIFSPETVKCCLSLMYSCGMYDYSGEFAFSTGLPGKSGVSGSIVLVVPQVMGITIFSPRLDRIGNSVRGIQFAHELVEAFNFHNYDNLVLESKKTDPTLSKNSKKLDAIMSLIWAASQGDVFEIKHLLAQGVDINEGDYDRRTALHLASAEGHVDVVQYLLDKGADKNVKDRWGQLPIDDAKQKNHADVVKILI